MENTNHKIIWNSWWTGTISCQDNPSLALQLDAVNKRKNMDYPYRLLFEETDYLFSLVFILVTERDKDTSSGKNKD